MTLLRFIRRLSKIKAPTHSFLITQSTPRYISIVRNTTNVLQNNWKIQNSSTIKFVITAKACFSSYPSHKILPMPALSPTMEMGSIAKWNLKEGDKFEVGTAICEVETDKATVTFDATDEGYLAKILVGNGEVKVGEPIMVVVDEANSVNAFSSFKIDSAPTSTTPVAPVVVANTDAPAPVITSVASTPTIPSYTDRIFASPLAKKLAKESNISLSDVVSALGTGSGPSGRIVAADILKAVSMPRVTADVKPTAASTSASSTLMPSPQMNVNGVFSDFELSDVAKQLASKLTIAKKVVPHYYLSVEINLTNVLKVREDFHKVYANEKKPASKGKDGKTTEDDGTTGISVQDFLIKAAALSMKAVPDVNASWMDTFVRKYHQVDINLVIGTGSYVATPVIRDVTGKGISQISQEVASFENILFSNDEAAVPLQPEKMAAGTFSIHNMSIYGVKSAAPIVMTPQACALSLGAIIDTVIPAESERSESNWEVAPIMVATLSCDHRVVDGAVGAQWLSAFKGLVEDPVSMLL